MGNRVYLTHSVVTGEAGLLKAMTLAVHAQHCTAADVAAVLADIPLSLLGQEGSLRPLLQGTAHPTPRGSYASRALTSISCSKAAWHWALPVEAFLGVDPFCLC